MLTATPSNVEAQLPNVLASPPVPGAAPSGLSKKLLAAKKEIRETGRVQKNGHNDTQNYDFAQAADVYDHVQRVLEAHGLLVTTEQDSEELIQLETKNGGRAYVSKVVLIVTMEDVETGEKRIWKRCVGYGFDTLDKHLYKAFTGALKYWHILVFQLATGDDPEQPNAAELTAKKKAEEKTRNEGASTERQLTPEMEQRGIRARGIYNAMKRTDLASEKDMPRWAAAVLGLKDSHAWERWTDEQMVKLEAVAGRIVEIVTEANKAGVNGGKALRGWAAQVLGSNVPPSQWVGEAGDKLLAAARADNAQAQ